MNLFKLVTYTLITLFLLGCGEQNEKSKTETSNNNKPTNPTSLEDCYNSAYNEIREANAEDLIESGTYKSKDEIPEQELVPAGVRMSLEEDCKEKFKGK